MLNLMLNNTNKKSFSEDSEAKTLSFFLLLLSFTLLILGLRFINTNELCTCIAAELHSLNWKHINVSPKPFNDFHCIFTFSKQREKSIIHDCVLKSASQRQKKINKRNFLNLFFRLSFIFSAAFLFNSQHIFR